MLKNNIIYHIQGNIFDKNYKGIKIEIVQI